MINTQPEAPVYRQFPVQRELAKDVCHQVARRAVAGGGLVLLTSTGIAKVASGGFQTGCNGANLPPGCLCRQIAARRRGLQHDRIARLHFRLVAVPERFDAAVLAADLRLADFPVAAAVQPLGRVVARG